MRYRFEYKAYRRPFRVPVRTSRGLWEKREGIIVRLEREDGRAAYGEIAPIEAFGTETLLDGLAWCESLGREADEEQLTAIPRELPCCAAAIGAALADFENLGASSNEPTRRRRPVTALLPTGPTALEAIGRFVETGFLSYKMKVGAAGFAEERRLVDRLVARLPERASLRLDANGGLAARLAAQWLAAAEDWPLEFFEQPLAPESDRDLLALAGDWPTPLALDESVRTADDLKRWRDRGWPGLFVIKPALGGPPRELAVEIALAPETCVFSSALETAVGAAAGLRFAFAFEGRRALGYGVDAFFPEDGLGLPGGMSAPWFGLEDLARCQVEHVWKQL